MAEYSAIFDVNAQNFQTEVIEKSQEAPVLLLLWTDQIPPSTVTRRNLETLARQYQGKFLLALSDVSKDPTIAQHLRVQAVPSIRVVKDGQVVEQLDGPQEESNLRELVDRLTLSDSELLKSSLQEVIQREDWDTAIQLLKKALKEEPNNPGYRVEWADVLAQKGDLKGARKVMDAIPDDTPDLGRPKTRIELAEEAMAMGSLKDAEDMFRADASDLEVQYRLSILLASNRRYREALDQAMQILSTDRGFRDDIGRLTMIRIMVLLPRDSPLSQEYRQEMFNIMH